MNRGAPMKTLLVLLLLVCGGALQAALPPLRDCTLTAPVSAVAIPRAQLQPYIKGDQLVLETKGIILPPAAGKNIEAKPTGDNTTSFRTAVNYHRALHKGDIDAIASYWHPSERARVKAHFSKPGVMDAATSMFARLQNVELLGLLELGGREVIFIRYTKTTMPFACVEMDGEYFIVNDPSISVPAAIACAAFDEGTKRMAPPE